MAKKGEKEPMEQERGRGLQRMARRGQLMSPFDEMEMLFDRFFPRGWMRPFRGEGWPEMPFGGRMPRVDVLDRENEVVVRAEVPGVNKENLDVSLTEDTVTIRGSTQREEKEEEGEYYRREMEYGEFCRTVGLPALVDTENAKARFKDGVLEVTLPKTEQARRRSIKVEE